MGKISKQLIENFGYKLNENDDWVSAQRDEQDVIAEIKALITQLKSSRDPSAEQLARAAQKRLDKFLATSKQPPAQPAEPAQSAQPSKPGYQKPEKKPPQQSSGLTPEEQKRLDFLMQQQQEYEAKKKAK